MQRWMPRPNAAWRFSSRSMSTTFAFSNWASSRLAAGNGRSTQSSSFICTPWNSTSSLTRRAMVTGAYARRNSSTACGIISGFSDSLRRSTALVARCHSDDPMPDQVVSMPAMRMRSTVPCTWCGVSFWPSISASSRNEMRSSRGFSTWSAMWRLRYASNSMNWAMRSSVRSSPMLPRMRFTHPRNLSASSSGSPSISAMMSTGMCWLYSSAASTSVRSPILSMRSLHIFSILERSGSIFFGENAGSSRRRAPAWKGGSLVIGGAPPMGAGAASSTWLGFSWPTTTLRLVKWSVS